MKISLLIVTMNRPDDLARCLATVRQQTNGFNQVVIVDASAQSSEQLMNEYSDVPIEYYRSEPGITRQRNVGLQHIADDTDIVLFVDDDTELSKMTTSQLSEFFEHHPDAVGVTGTILGEASHSLFKRIIGKLALLYTSKPYGITLGLFNIINAAKDVQSVDWLPGAFMAYRYQTVKHLTFDEWFTTYGLAEDLEFSLRVKQLGDLYVDPTIHVTHHHSPEGRNWRRFGSMRIQNRRYILNKHFSRNWNYRIGYYWANMWLFVFNAARSLVSTRYRDEFRGNLVGIVKQG